MKEKDVLSYKDFVIEEFGVPYDDNAKYSNEYMAAYGRYLVRCSYELNNPTPESNVIQLTEEDIKKANKKNKK